ncbi:Crp/Fnr family transcriptional regulator [Actinophytocola sediminis]
MGFGLVENIVKWHRRGTDDPWLPDSFMAGLSPESIGRLERHATLLANLNQIDWMAADSPVIIVLSGTVRIYRLRQDGHQTIDRIAGIGDVLNGENLFIDPVPASLRGKLHTLVMAVPRHKFRELLSSDEEIARATMHAMAYWIRETTLHRSHSGRRVDQRLWAFLVTLGRRHGSLFGGSVELDLGLTQADLAAAIGASPNAVETALQRLRQAGRLSTNYAWCMLHAPPPTEEELDLSF